MKRGRIAIPMALVGLFLVGWGLSARAETETEGLPSDATSAEVQSDSTSLSGETGGELKTEASGVAAEESLLRASQLRVETFAPLTFDATAFEIQSPSEAVYGWDLDGDEAYDEITSSPVLVHTYRQNGVHLVRVHVTDPSGTDILSDPLEVTVDNRPPVARFEVPPEAVTDTEAVAFSDASTDIDGEVVSRSWTFGDGSASDERNPSHRFPSAGVYTVTLMVIDEAGSSSEPFSSSVTVGNTGPTAAFSAP
jgi:PKD repeat protein